MRKIDLKTAAQELFAYRPDEAFSFDETYGQFKRWKAKAWRCKRGEVCVKAGDPAAEFLAVASGRLHVCVPSEYGEDVILRVVEPGGYVGLTHVFAARAKHGHDVVAAVGTDIITFDVAEVRRGRSEPDLLPLYDFLGSMLSDACNEAHDQATIMGGANIAERLRRYLAIRMESSGKREIVLPGTVGDLAKYLGVSRCALSRTIGQLRERGAIKFDRSVFTVLSAW